jgi:riboflavin biosynthesis pyrimidine reductase
MNLLYRSLLGAGAPAELTLEQVLDGLSLPLDAASERPYVLLNMISTADGRATIAGRSGPIGGSGDRELFHGLRTLIDAVLIGASTLRVERYNRIVDDENGQARRRARGLSEQPLACVVSGSLALDAAIPLLANPSSRVVMLTPSQATIAPVEAEVEYIRASDGGHLDLPACLQALRQRFGVRTLLCEGGPHLAGQLLANGLIDELFLTLAPKLVSGALQTTPGPLAAAPGEGAPTAPAVALPLLSGQSLNPPAPLSLVSVLECDSYLFLRYRATA